MPAVGILVALSDPALAVLMLIVVAIPIRFWVRAPCPRCSKTFGFPRRTWSWRDPTWTRQCVHCGLPYGAPCDPDKAEE